MKFRIFWSILAVLCFIYGILVFLTGSGTGFFIVWFLLCALCLACALFSGRGRWKRLPKALKTMLILILIVFLGLFFFVEALILTGFKDTSKKDLDVIIVLGAQVYESGPSVVLKHRLDEAFDYLQENPATVCIVTGAKGPNEPFSEAEGMRRYLISRGINEGRIILEDQALDTKQNISYSMKLFDAKKESVGIISNNFHMYRALRLAKKAGLSDVYGIPAPSTPLYLPNNMLREFFGVVKSFVAG
ncbi:MAG: YdcF family protein [Lachnospiraceae bacterium]|nr:YdcF family protein [Lachnospiraceae bacterium]